MPPTPVKTLLTIDDDEGILVVIQTFLEMTADWRVLTAKSGHDGLNKAQSHPLDAILLDGQMPGIDGIETLHHLRRHPLTQHIPVVFITARPDLIAPLDQTELGVKGILAKPFEPLALANQVSSLLGWYHGPVGTFT